MTEIAFCMDPGEWVRGTVLEPTYEATEYVGIFHVTTQLQTLENNPTLKSRRQLGGIQGLGGGERHGPDRVSTVFDLERAMVLWGAMRSVVRAVRGEMTPSELAKAMLRWLGFPHAYESWLDTLEQEAADVEEEENTFLDGATELLQGLKIFGVFPEDPEVLRGLRSQATWMELISNQSRRIDRAFASGPDVYQMVQTIEAIVDENFGRAFHDGEADMILCSRQIGFVAPYEIFSKISPDQISVLQLAAKKGCKADWNPDECEVRFFPGDLRILRYRVEELGPIRWKNDEIPLSKFSLK